MANTARRLWTVALSMAALTMASAAFAGEPTVVLNVTNQARFPRAAVQAAERIAAEIYTAVGVRVVWSEDLEGPLPESSMRVAIVLLSGEAERYIAGLPGNQRLGVAPLNSGRAYLFCDRIRDLARTQERPVELVLGRVLAHEVGHQLLPAEGHSKDGIMRAVLDYRSEAPRFTAIQSESIRERLLRN